MDTKFKIGVLKETKTPPDKRVALPPAQALELKRLFPNVEVYVQPSDIRCYKDSEYSSVGITLKDDLSDCDLLLGVKEVKIPYLVPNKSYLFFAHVAKKQPHNQPLIQAIAQKGITLLDHEYLTDRSGIRLVAFGHWAGVVGAYNALRARGIRTNRYYLPAAHQCHDYKELISELRKVKLDPKKILVTGGGRVANGAMEIFKVVHLKEVNPEDFLTKEFNEPVICRIDPWHYAKRKDGKPFDWDYWSKSPMEHESSFLPFTKVTDILVACHYWDFRSPMFFTKEEMLLPDFKISIIADISCDIPGPIPSTLRASTIANPFFDFNPITGKEESAFSGGKNITVMSIDNLPGELPRDASEDFGKTLIEKIFPHFLCGDCEGVIERATILKDGKLTEKYSYLKNYLEGKE
ncbi:MAG: alanine dehydrogenase [Bacteroidales bacterium]|nr:alanine dehydrogenase [Bacteroidales bacterium]